jgi:hypothetical protein
MGLPDYQIPKDANFVPGSVLYVLTPEGLFPVTAEVVGACYAAIRMVSLLPTNFAGGPVTVGITSVGITFAGATKSISLQSDHDNAGALYLGKSAVGSGGAFAVARLEAGESFSLDYNTLEHPLYVVASIDGQTMYMCALQ